MLRIFVLDVSAESRQQIIDELHAVVRAASDDVSLLPRVDIRPISRQELRFQEEPDILLVGEALIREFPADITELRKQFPSLGILVRLPKNKADLASIEQLARLGVDDTLIIGADAHEIMRKLVILGRRKRKVKSGSFLVVDGGKGGVGITSVAASLAEYLATLGKKVALVDFDCESQDLSRFLQAAPYVNENLQLLLDQQRPVTEEFVLQSVGQVFELGSGSLSVVAPPPETETLYSTGAQYSRIFISFFEILDSKFDVVIVDGGSARGAILKTLYRIADGLVFVLNNDPACLYAGAERLARCKPLLSPQAELFPFLNSVQKHGLSPDLVKREFAEAVGIEISQWVQQVAPFSLDGSRWPGSGATLFSLAGKKVQHAIRDLGARLGFGATLALGAARRPQLLEGAKELLEYWVRLKNKRQSEQAGPSQASDSSVLSNTQNAMQINLPDSSRLALPTPQPLLPQFEKSSGTETQTAKTNLSRSNQAESGKLVSGARFI